MVIGKSKFARPMIDVNACTDNDNGGIPSFEILFSSVLILCESLFMRYVQYVCVASSLKWFLHDFDFGLLLNLCRIRSTTSVWRK